MYGYLKPFVPELKIKDYQTYQAFRRGLARQLLKDYSLFSCVLVQKDMIAFAILSDSLAGREGTVFRLRNLWTGFRRQSVLSQTKGIRLAARVQVLLMWRKLNEMIDMTQNPLTKLRLRFVKFLLHRDHEKALEDEGRLLHSLILQESDHMVALRQTRCSDYHIATVPSENFFSALFLHCASDEASWKSLRQVGAQIGHIYFMIQMVQHYEYDKVSGGYNVFIENGLSKKAAIESAKRQCNLAAVELAKAFSLLNVKMNRTLLDNIVYLGLEHAVENIGAPTVKREEGLF